MAYDEQYRSCAEHPPSFQAGCESERQSFQQLVKQDIITDNLLLTGLSGVGKTVLLESLRSYSVEENWLWIGVNLGDSRRLKELDLMKRLCVELARLLTSLEVKAQYRSVPSELDSESQLEPVSFGVLSLILSETPGLPLDKLKRLIDFACASLARSEERVRGVVFAFEEAHNLTDRAEDHQFPLSLVLDTFQSLQRKGLPILLVLSGLPYLKENLLDTRGFAERMFKFVNLD